VITPNLRRNAPAHWSMVAFGKEFRCWLDRQICPFARSRTARCRLQQNDFVWQFLAVSAKICLTWIQQRNK
jgi:hypothetical protein